MELQKAIYNAVFKLEDSGNKKEAKDLILSYIETAQKLDLSIIHGDYWYEMDINPSAIISGE